MSSALSAFVIMRLTSYFMGGQMMVFQAELYLGLLVFSGYILFDTQASVTQV